MEFQVLGSVRVVQDGAEVAVPGALQQTLLAVLVARAGGRVPVDVLVESLWPNGPQAGGAQKLQVHVHRLRRLLGGAEWIAFEHDAYRLAVTASGTDIGRFEHLADTAATASDPARRAACAREALALWRGTPFAGLDVPLLADEAGRLAERRMSVVELRFAAELRAGRHAEIIPELTDLVAADPLRERLCGLLMTALYRAGRQVDALAAFRATRRAVVEELGLEPGPELRAVEQQILAGDAVELEAPTGGVVAPAQLPHLVPHFVGRDAELSELDDVLAGGERSVCVLAGTAGVGKTTLAIRWAHRVRERFPDGQLYVNLCGYGPDEPATSADALAGFLRALGVPDEDIPLDETERAARFRTMVDGRRMLVVLDDARTAEQVRPLLPGSSSCFVLVTSRDTMTGLTAREGASRLNLGLLTVEQARALLRELVGHRAAAEPDAIDVLIERCARLPLALRIVAELIGLRGGTRIAELVTELAGEQDRLDALDLDDAQSSVRAVFASSYGHLAPAAASVFRLFGLHPRRELDSYALAALADMELRTVTRAVDRLVRANLVDRMPDGRLRMHDLLRAYVRELVSEVDSPAERNAALGRMFDYYLATSAAAMNLTAPYDLQQRPDPPRPSTPIPSFPDSDRAMRWLDTERDNLVGVAALAVHRDRPEVTCALSATLFRYLDNGHRDDAFVIHQNALIAATAQGDPLAEALAVRYLGIVFWHMGDLDSSLDFAQRAYRIYRDLDEHRSQAFQLLNLGWLYITRGEYRDALVSFEAALVLHNHLGADSLPGYARTLRGIGLVEQRLGLTSEARRHLRDAAEISVATGDRRNESLSLIELGNLYERFDDLDEARDLLERAREIARDAATLAEASVYPLGWVYYRLGRKEDAFACVWRCIGSARDTGVRIDEVGGLNLLGKLCLADRRPREALDHYRDALAISEESGDRPGQADAHAGLGDAYSALDHLDRARECWQAAKRVYGELGVPDEREVAEKLAGLSAP